jgi:hypothetical protein
MARARLEGATKRGGTAICGVDTGMDGGDGAEAA